MSRKLQQAAASCSRESNQEENETPPPPPPERTSQRRMSGLSELFVLLYRRLTCVRGAGRASEPGQRARERYDNSIVTLQLLSLLLGARALESHFSERSIRNGERHNGQIDRHTRRARLVARRAECCSRFHATDRLLQLAFISGTTIDSGFVKAFRRAERASWLLQPPKVRSIRTNRQRRATFRGSARRDSGDLFVATRQKSTKVSQAVDSSHSCWSRVLPL